MSGYIENIVAREILDSRGNPTVEALVRVDDTWYTASVPSGASTGSFEAVELRDGDMQRYNGKGVLNAVMNVNGEIRTELMELISDELSDLDVTCQREIDAVLKKLDGTDNYSRLGANATLAVSRAVARAGAGIQGIPLYEHLASVAGITPDNMVMPVPAFNVINGGAHADNSLDIQEYMILPIGAESFAQALQIGAEIYHGLKKELGRKNEKGIHIYGAGATNVGDEGGYAPPGMVEVEAPIEVILKVVEQLGYANKVYIGLDCAASEFYGKKPEDKVSSKDGLYHFGGERIHTQGMSTIYQALAGKYPIVSIEDPFHEEDWVGFNLLTARLGNNVQIVGDDLFVTNPKRMQIGYEKGAANAVLLKDNQIGTVSEAIDAALLAKKYGWNMMMSHRSGETEDSFIADMAVALGTGQIKSGAPARTDRLAKYNQLLRIESDADDRQMPIRFPTGYLGQMDLTHRL